MGRPLLPLLPLMTSIIYSKHHRQSNSTDDLCFTWPVSKENRFPTTSHHILWLPLAPFTDCCRLLAPVMCVGRLRCPNRCDGSLTSLMSTRGSPLRQGSSNTVTHK